MLRITVESQECFEAIDITRRVPQASGEAGVASGLARLHCPDTTATLVVNDPADPDVAWDILVAYRKLVPHHPGIRSTATRRSRSSCIVRS